MPHQIANRQFWVVEFQQQVENLTVLTEIFLILYFLTSLMSSLRKALNKFQIRKAKSPFDFAMWIMTSNSFLQHCFCTWVYDFMSNFHVRLACLLTLGCIKQQLNYWNSETFMTSLLNYYSITRHKRTRPKA